MTHICVGKLTIIGSDNGLSPGRRQAIIWTNAGILLIGPLETNFSEIWIGIQTFSLKKIHLKISSAKWCLFCLGLDDFIRHHRVIFSTYQPSWSRGESIQYVTWDPEQFCSCCLKIVNNFRSVVGEIKIIPVFSVYTIAPKFKWDRWMKPFSWQSRTYVYFTLSISWQPMSWLLASSLHWMSASGPRLTKISHLACHHWPS